MMPTFWPSVQKKKKQRGAAGRWVESPVDQTVGADEWHTNLMDGPTIDDKYARDSMGHQHTGLDHGPGG